MPTLDASSPAAVYDDTQAATALTTAAFTPPAGSVVVAKVMTSDFNMTPNTPTATGLTFTSRTSGGTAGSTAALSIFTAAGAGASTTVTATFAQVSGQARWLVVEVWTAAQLAATPATNFATRATFPTAPSSTVTTTGTGSVVTWACVDWDGTNTAGTYRSSAVQDAFHFASGPTETLYSAYQAAATAGAQTYGLTAPTQNWVMAALEIQNSGAAAPVRFRTIGKRR